MRWAGFSAAALLAACGTRAPLGQTPIVEMHVEDAAPAVGGPVNADPAKRGPDAATSVDAGRSPAVVPPVVDGSLPVEDAGVSPTDVFVAADVDVGGADAGRPISCAELAAGGQPARLEAFQWEYQVPYDGPYQAPYESLDLDGTCAATYRRVVMSPSMTTTAENATLSAADCLAARGWATNARFLEVLRTGDGCPYGPGNPGDLFELTLADEGRVARKTYLCPEPTMDAERACLRDLIARVFPKK